MQKQRKSERVSGIKTLALTVRGKQYDVNNICDRGVGILLEDSSTFSVGESLGPIELTYQGRSVSLEGEVVHVTPLSDLRENFPLQNEPLMCGIQFVFKTEENRELFRKVITSLIYPLGGD